MPPNSLRQLILLHASALRLALAAQRVQKMRFDRVIPQLLAASHLPTDITPSTAIRVTARTCRLVGLLGMLNSCLIRSLVLGSLVSDRPGVKIHFGFRRRSADTEGHAWVSLDRLTLRFADDEQDNFEHYTIAQSFSMDRQANKPSHD